MIGVYRITHIATGRHYVGQSVNIPKRWQSHLGRDSHIGRALRKHGPSAFEFVVICTCAIAELDALEARWVKELYANTLGFNKSTGGAQPRLNEASKKKLGESQRARWKADHARLAAATKAAVTRQDVRDKTSATVKKYFDEMAPEQRKRLRDALIARTKDPRIRRKIGASTKERWTDPETRKRMLKTGPVPANRREGSFIFEHADGRVVQATLWEMANVHKHLTTQKAHNLISGYRKTAKGWKLTGAVLSA